MLKLLYFHDQYLQIRVILKVEFVARLTVAKYTICFILQGVPINMGIER